MMNKYFFLALALLLILPMVSATGLGTYKQNSCVPIFVPSNSSTVNLTAVQHQTTNEILNVLMTKSGNGFSYSFCNTSDIGDYNYGYCYDDGTCYGNWFTINAQGMEYTATQGLVYCAVLFIMIGIFVVFLYYSIAIDGENFRNEDREIVFINYKKYLKYFLFTLAYITFVFITFIAWNISAGILNFDSLAKFFSVLFFISSKLLYLVIPVMIYYAIRKYIQEDKPLIEEIKRGIVQNE